MSTLLRGIFHGAESAGVRGAESLGRGALHGIEGSALHSASSTLTSGARGGLSQVDHAIAQNAFRAGAGDTSRAVESATNDALRGSVQRVEPNVTHVNTNNKYDWKAITAMGVVGTGGGLVLNHEVRRDAKDMKDAMANVAEEAKQAITDAAAKAREDAAAMAQHASDYKRHAEDAARDLAQHLPSSTAIASGLTGVASSATMLLVAGLGVFVAYEAYRFSRGSN